jgi:hypothetical protein
VRTLQPLEAGTFVFEFVGEILTNAEMMERNDLMSTSISYSLQLNADWRNEVTATDYEALCIDGAVFSNVSRFLNHRCDGSNLLDMPVRINDKNPYYYHVFFFTNRSVEPLEELTWVSLLQSFVLHTYNSIFAKLRMLKIPLTHFSVYIEMQDYGIDFGQVNNQIPVFCCLCESEDCRDPRWQY